MKREALGRGAMSRVLVYGNIRRGAKRCNESSFEWHCYGVNEQASNQAVSMV